MSPMIYKIEIENFYSVRDFQEIDLRISSGVRENPERFGSVFPGSIDRVPKVVAIFGPNGSGKSTVLKALSFVSWFIKDSFSHAGKLPCERFNDESSANRPIKLAVELGGLSNLAQHAETPRNFVTMEYGHYRYELSLLPDLGNIRKVEREALYHKPNGKGKWARVFERDEKNVVQGSKMFSLSGLSKITEKIRSDASVISTLSLFEHVESKTIIEASKSVFNNILIDRQEPSDLDAVFFLDRNPSVLEQLNRELQRIDVGVETMHILPTSAGPTAYFKHRGLQLDMPWLYESHGTRAFIRIFPYIMLALDRGGIAVIDEIDQSIHPLVLPEIIRWFYDDTRNKHGAQLWMSAHSVSLLEDFLKEEVLLCEKDSMGRSSVYSMMDIQSLRRDENLYKKYMGGTYGAVPHIG